jgi:hypothetical protein
MLLFRPPAAAQAAFFLFALDFQATAAPTQSRRAQRETKSKANHGDEPERRAAVVADRRQGLENQPDKNAASQFNYFCCQTKENPR